MTKHEYLQNQIDQAEILLRSKSREIDKTYHQYKNHPTERWRAMPNDNAYGTFTDLVKKIRNLKIEQRKWR